jgi:hypothetical protein
MEPMTVGLVADSDVPTEVALRMGDLGRRDRGDLRSWDLQVVNEPFTLGSEDVGTALSRLREQADRHGWELVVGLTELPLRAADGRYLLVETDPGQRTVLVSLPALGGFRLSARARLAVRSLVDGIADSPAHGEHRVALRRWSGRWRLLRGMVLANRPWLLVPGLKSALVAALATGAVATVDDTVWVLAGSLSRWRLLVASVVSIALVVGWLVVDGELWDRPENESAEARERSHLYNTSTLLTLTAGVLICHAALYVVNLAWALFVLDPDVMRGSVQTPFGYGDLFVLAWFVASAASVGGALGSGLESDDAIRAAAYSKREEERRDRLARQRHHEPDG